MRLFFQSVTFLLGSGIFLVLFPLAASGEKFGLTPEETYREKTHSPDQVLFIDVRDPVEIQFTGFTDLVDQNIPFLLVDRYQWSEERNRFRLPRNPAFIAQVDEALKERGLNRDSRIITMCRSGSARGEPSAAFLRENGFPNAHFVINGFQGDTLEEGANVGRRLLNGWQNSGLPWSSELSGEKIFRPSFE